MALEGEPDFNVSGNLDLGRLFQLLVQGQQNTNRVMDDLRDTAVRSLHMAQTFMTGAGPNGAYQARMGVSGGPASNPQAGNTTQQSMGAQRVFSVSSVGVASSSGNTRASSPIWGLPPVGMTTQSSLSDSYDHLRNRTSQNMRESWSRSFLGTWSPYWSDQSGGGSGNNGGYDTYGNNFWAGSPGGQLGGGPYGMGPSGMPPNPIYFGGYGSPHGMYGPYGPYGPSNGVPGSGGGLPGGGNGYGGYGNYGGGGGGYGGPGGSGGGGRGGGGGGSAGPGHLWGMNSGIGAWARKNIPGVGLIDKAFGEVKSQRDKNEYYQNIQGGSNFSGFAERFHEEAYVASTTGLYSDAEARAAFKGVTRLGYNGRVGDQFSQQGGRQDALNFIYHGKTSYGASVSESLQQLEIVSKNSTLSLQNLQKALKDISDTAGTAGVNAQMARAQLMGLVQQGVQAGYGSGSIPTAQNLQAGKTSLGRSYEDIDVSGQMGQQYAYMASSQMGMTYNQYMAMQSTSPLAASQARAGENLSLLSQIFTQDEVNWVKQQAQSLGGRLDSNTALAIVPQFLQAFPNHNLSVIAQQLAAFGIVNTSDPQKAVAYAFTLIAGNNGDLASAQKTSAGTQPMSASEAAKAEKSSSSGLIKGFSTNPSPTKSGTAGGKAGWELGHAASGGDSQAMSAYKDQVAKNHGERNPVIENLLQHVSDQDQAQVVVHTSKGERVVSLQDAIKSHSEELSSGSASFVSGSEKGKTVKDLLGAGSVSTSSNWTQEAAKSKDTSGQSLQDWQKKHPDKSSTGSGTGANGKVVVDLSDSARQLLKIASASGIAGAYGEGAPPLNSYNWNANR